MYSPIMKYLAHALLALLVPAAGFASEVKIDFEAPHYSPGQRLWGQGAPGIKWAGQATDVFEVVSGVGANGSAALMINARGLDYPNAILEIAPRSLGLTGDADQNVVSYRFAFKAEELAGDAVIARLRLAGGAVQFEFYGTGNGFAFDGAAPGGSRHRNLRTAAGDRNILRPGEFIVVSGVIDYPAKTFTVLVNDVPQLDGKPLAFITDDTRLPDAGQVIRFEVTPHMQSKSAWRPVVLDDISFAPVAPVAK